MGIKLVKYGIYASSINGVISHDDLKDRDLENQHPIGAIDGLQEILDTLTLDSTHINRELLDSLAIDKNKNLVYKNGKDTVILIDANNLKNYEHKHLNKAILDAFSESTDGELLYNNEPIKVKVSKKEGNRIEVLSDGIFVAKEIVEDTGDSEADSSTAQVIELFNLTTKFEIGDLICYNKEIKAYQKANGSLKNNRDVIGMVIKIENNITTVQISGLFKTDLFKYYTSGEHLYLSNYLDGKVTNESAGAYRDIGIKIDEGLIIRIADVEIKNLTETEIKSIVDECFNQT